MASDLVMMMMTQITSDIATIVSRSACNIHSVEGLSRWPIFHLYNLYRLNLQKYLMLTRKGYRYSLILQGEVMTMKNSLQLL